MGYRKVTVRLTLIILCILTVQNNANSFNKKIIAFEEVKPASQSEEKISNKPKREIKLTIEELVPPDQSEENVSDKSNTATKVTVKELNSASQSGAKRLNERKNKKKITDIWKVTGEELKPPDQPKRNISVKAKSERKLTIEDLGFPDEPEENIYDKPKSERNLMVKELELPAKPEENILNRSKSGIKLRVEKLEPPDQPEVKTIKLNRLNVRKSKKKTTDIWKKLTSEELKPPDQPKKIISVKPKSERKLTIEDLVPTDQSEENAFDKSDTARVVTVEKLDPIPKPEENISNKPKSERKLTIEDLDVPDLLEENLFDKPKSERKLTVEELKSPAQPKENISNKPKSGIKSTVEEVEPSDYSENLSNKRKSVKLVMVDQVEPPLQPVEKILCHDDSLDSVLPVIDDNFKPPERSIFFHETSCKADLNSRQACAIESAAKQNLNWQIHVFFSSSVPKQAMSNGIFPTLQNMSNVHLHRLRLSDYVKGTPLERILVDKPLPDTAEATVLPCVTLYKYGGIYLDLDVVVLKPLGFLEWNFASTDYLDLATAVLAFSRNKAGREIAAEVISNLVYDVAANGPKLEPSLPGILSRILTKRCNTTDVHKMNVATCDGFQVYDSKYFYPISSLHGSQYFEKTYINNDEVFVHHIVSESTKQFKVDADSPYYSLARKFCPEIFNLYKERFGN